LYCCKYVQEKVHYKQNMCRNLKFLTETFPKWLLLVLGGPRDPKTKRLGYLRPIS
jgi:hypothetical protein